MGLCLPGRVDWELYVCLHLSVALPVTCDMLTAWFSALPMVDLFHSSLRSTFLAWHISMSTAPSILLATYAPARDSLG
jgi:hypothetical protein